MRDNCFTFLRYVFALGIFCNHLCITRGEDIFLCNSAIFVAGFFAMSGFLNFNSYQNLPDVKRFVMKRIQRIYPPYAIAVFGAFIASLFLTVLPLETFLKQSETWSYLWANLLFLNFLQPTLPGMFEENVMPFINSSLWTMKIEVLFYISLPMVHWAMKRWGTNRTLLSIILLSLSYYYATLFAYLYTENPLFSTLNYQFPGELCFFYIPVLMLNNWTWVKKHLNALLGTSAALLLLYCADWHFQFLLPLFLPVLVITFGYGCKWLLRTAVWKDFSYEFYLFHFPLLQILFMAKGTGLPTVSAFFVILPVIFIIAIAVHYLCRYVLKISFQLFLVDFGVDLGARPQGHSELWPKGLSPKMPKSNKNNGR